MSTDLLADRPWRCAATAPGAVLSPAELAGLDLQWYPATVPGTAAAAVRAAEGRDAALARDYDAQDWWFVTTLGEAVGAGPWTLHALGLATVAEVWVDECCVARSESMYTTTTATLDTLAPGSVLALRFAALRPLLGVSRRPRARWRSLLVDEQNLRWWRTSLLGRAPLLTGTAAVVGPHRPLTLHRRPDLEVLSRDLHTGVRGDTGVLEVRARLRGAEQLRRATVRVGAHQSTVDLEHVGDEAVLHAVVEVPAVARWWPHTHGDQPLYPVHLHLGERELDWGTVGFRDVQVGTDDGGFALSVNGVAVFCRGACWTPLDPVGLSSDPDALRAALTAVREAGLNMLRVTGTMTYEEPELWRLCAELGLLVWQDAMLATLDPPAEEHFEALLRTEVEQLCTALQGNPALAVLSGGSETEQQPTMLGLDATRRCVPAVHELVPAVARRLLPGVPCVSSSPSGGALPIHVGTGVAHYFGVGGYLRPLTDVRTAGVRFAAECLAFATPPEAAAVEREFGSAAVAGHHPRWKAAVPRDHGASWDFEDVRDHYVRTLFGVQPAEVRRHDPARYLDLGRAAVCEAVQACFEHWRRAESGCAGALVLTLRDLEPGAGWGLLDSTGAPKAPWYVLRRLSAPVAVSITDEGLDGLRVDAWNDRPHDLPGVLVVTAHQRLGARQVLAETDVVLPAHGSGTWWVDALVGTFLDLNHAHGFGPQTYDALTVQLRTATGSTRAVRLLGGADRPLQTDVGLAATATRDGDGGWALEISTRGTAQHVHVDVAGFLPEDSWFHLGAGDRRVVALRPTGPDAPALPAGTVGALSSLTAAPVVLPR
ncbi:glycosyl hydrolase [Rhodococcus sp. X156]|uniref:glycosyl hydrolase n=1 Tax=Rhodococcus sp. X156 TaxID=2499145 RepID=UPI000FD8F436|nr:glycosyl hydrolase [Rhodococcus sp. X156]